MNAQEMFKRLGYECDISCDGVLYSKYVGDINIQISFDWTNMTVEKRKETEVFKPYKPEEITLDELDAIHKQFEEQIGRRGSSINRDLRR